MYLNENNSSNLGHASHVYASHELLYAPSKYKRPKNSTYMRPIRVYESEMYHKQIIEVGTGD